MHIKAPRLLINRFGVYYFRYKSDGVEKRISLRTKCSTTANIIALQLNLAIESKRAMSNPKLIDFDFGSLGRYEITLPNGVHIKTDGSQEDHSRAMEALENIGPLLQHTQPAPIIQQTAPVIPKSESLILAVKKWLANCAGKNGARTVVTKTYHIKDFMARSFAHIESVERWLAESQNTDFLKERGLRTVEARKVRGDYKTKDIESNAISKKTLTDYKAMLSSGDDAQTAKTIDNKLDSLKDFFDYAIGHGLYTLSQDNPVRGLHIHTKKTRKASTQSFQPFPVSALQVLFEPKAYLARMNEPDLFWGPLLGVYSSMRIGEATQIRVQDVHLVDNGVHYIHVHKSKTVGGIRNVPIAQALIDMGFLQYVDECEAAGAERIAAFVKNIAALIDELGQNPFSGSPTKDWLVIKSLLRQSLDPQLQQVAVQLDYLVSFNRGKRIAAGLSQLWEQYGCYRGAENAFEVALAQDQLLGGADDPNSLQLMTVHKSKGKQFDGVIIFRSGRFDEKEGQLSSFIWRDDIRPYLRSRKILRVAITRAMTHTLILNPMYPPCEITGAYRLA